MSIDLKTVSTSLGITTKKAEASVDTLPIDIQAIEPISIWTTSSGSVLSLPEEIYKNTFIKTIYADNYQYPHVLTDSEISQKTAISVNTSNNYEKGIHQDPISVPIHIKGFGTRDAIVKKSIPTSFITENEVGTDAPNGTKHVFDSILFNSINNTTKTSHFIKTNLVPIHIKGYGTRSPIIQNLSKVNINTSGHTNTTTNDLLGAAGAFEMTLANHTNMVGGSSSSGNQSFITAGTHSWTAPAGVTSVAVVCVGTGANGGYQWSSGGGGGGGLGYKNSITVVPGTSYTVVVGAKGSQVSNATSSSGMGGNSYFISEATVCGFGGGRGGTDSTGSNNGGYGGGYTGDGGGRGGNGAWEGSWTRGGGGAGGYSGKGGDGGRDFEGSGLSSGSGGGGGGGNYWSSTYGVGAGGGVGLGGEGTSGAGGTTLNYGFGGRGGSGGQDGLDGENPVNSGNLTTANYQIYGGEYGGGGGGSGTSRGGGYGGIGAVRIVWGASVAFPSTNVGVAPTVGTSTTQVSDPITVFVENSSHTYSRVETINSNFDKITFDTKLSKIYGSSYYTNNLNEILIKNAGDDEFITQKFPSLRFDIKNTVFDGPTSKTKMPTAQTNILTGFDKSSNSPTFCNSLLFNFRIKMGPIAEWGHFTKDGVGSFSILNRDNDPRLTSASSSSSSSSSDGDSESSGSGGTGPVQSWSS